MSSEKGRWYRIDEHSYSVAATEYAAERFHEFCRNWQMLPWAILALHNAAQAAMVCHLTGTVGLGALEEKCARQVCAALHNNGPHPKEYVATFKELLRRTTCATHQLERAGEAVDLCGSDNKALERLAKLRNEFVHFSPKGWHVEISGMPEIASSWVKLMRGIQSGGWALRYCEDSEREAFARNVCLVEQDAYGAFD